MESESGRRDLRDSVWRYVLSADGSKRAFRLFSTIGWGVLCLPCGSPASFDAVIIVRMSVEGVL